MQNQNNSQDEQKNSIFAFLARVCLRLSKSLPASGEGLGPRVLPFLRMRGKRVGDKGKLRKSVKIERKNKYAIHRRYLSNQPQRFEEYIAAAKAYPVNRGLPDYMYSKPFDPTPGNKLYYELMFDVLNLLKEMDIPHRGRVMDVGCGPGWLIEILVGLGFEVDALDPSGDFITVAQERIKMHIDHYHIKNPPRVDFHCTTLEDCDLPDESLDAILFYASLHHIVDEDKGIAQCARMLRPGSCLGVSEAAWLPGDRNLETAIEEEMSRYHTLENPFTTEYLDELLRKHGFNDIRRFYQVNGLVPAHMENATVKSVAHAYPETHNIVIAYKSWSDRPTTADPNLHTLAKITVLDVVAQQSKLYVKAKLENQGSTIWLRRHSLRGLVTIALHQGQVGNSNFLEAVERVGLPRNVEPGQEIVVDCEFTIPENASQASWYLDLVNEKLFWFSSRGTQAAEVSL